MNGDKQAAAGLILVAGLVAVGFLAGFLTALVLA